MLRRVSSILLVALLVVGMLAAFGGAQQRSTSISVALYHDEGVWLNGLIAMEHMLNWMHIGWQEVDATALNEHGLNGFKIFWVPGGWSVPYRQKIQKSGRNAIREFVEDGGTYIGTCAGAYYAARVVIWEGELYDYSYDLNLFKGHANGPINVIAPWPQWSMTKVNLDTSSPINARQPTSLNMLYYGGPEFYPDATQQVILIGVWAATSKPAIISFNYGSGKVVLIGPHPEIGWDSETGTWDFNGGHGAQWPWLKQVIKWALYQSNPSQGGY